MAHNRKRAVIKPGITGLIPRVNAFKAKVATIFGHEQRRDGF